MITYTRNTLLNWKSKSFISHLLLSMTDGILPTKLYDKHDDFDFLIINFPYICSNIPEFQAYGVYISQLIRSAYGSFTDRGRLLTRKLVDQGYTLKK